MSEPPRARWGGPSGAGSSPPRMMAVLAGYSSPCPPGGSAASTPASSAGPGTRYHGAPTLSLVNLPATVMINLG